MTFDYLLDYESLDLRKDPLSYKVGKGEQGVLKVQPYKSELLPHWRFKTPEIAEISSAEIFKLFLRYKNKKDFVGMDMARKFLQMGYTRSRRYTNHSSGRKYKTPGGAVLPRSLDTVKAASAEVFYRAWKEAEGDQVYHDLKIGWRVLFG